MIRRICLATAAAFLLVMPLAAQSGTTPVEFSHAITANVGITWVGQPYSPTAAGVPADGIESHMLLPRFGFGFAFRTIKNQYIDLSLDFFFKEFVYRSDLKRAFPTQIETGRSTGPLALVMSLMPRAVYKFEFPISDRAVFGLGPGLGFNINIPVAALDDSTDIGQIGSYLFGAFKVPYFIGEFYFRFAVGSIIFSPQLRAYLPVYHLWDGEGLPFADRLIVNIDMALQFKLD